MRKMETIEDLIEEAKVRFLWWTICIFALTYFLSHTSKSMLMNIPIAALIAFFLRYLANELEFRWKASQSSKPTYLSYLEKKQISPNDPRLSTVPPPPKWRRKFDSPVIEAAVEDFVDKIIQDFVSDLWYSDITPDKEAPDLMRTIILEALGEVAGRVKEVNLVDLLTRDVVNLIGDHLELFRKTQASIGVDVMVTLSSEERDERLKHHLMASDALHPALISSESEYKFLQRLVAGLLGVVLKPREAQCPLVRCIAREFVTCLVIQPIINLVSPEYINQLVELVLLQIQEFLAGSDGDDHSSKVDHEHSVAEGSVENRETAIARHKNIRNQETDMGDQRKVASEVSPATSGNVYHSESMQPKVADWARVLDAATQRRTEVLAPENLENMWAIGRHYKDKINKSAKGQTHQEQYTKMIVEPLSQSSFIDQMKDINQKKQKVSHNRENDFALSMHVVNPNEGSDIILADGNKHKLKKSSSTSDLKVNLVEKKTYTGEGKGLQISEDFYCPEFGRQSGVHSLNDVPRPVIRAQGSSSTKLRCRVVGAYFEKIGSKSFAVYSIAVSDAQNSTWFVKRRYRNFERLHRLLKDIPNYNLHLPPKRIFSSSTEDAFVHQRCVQLDKYLQDLLSIANVAELHEVWDFLSASSKNYSFGKSASVMKTLAVNVDDAVDDIVRQFKGVSDGLVRKVVSSSSSQYGTITSLPARNLSLDESDLKMDTTLDASMEASVSTSDNEGIESHEPVAESAVKDNGWHSDNELKSKSFPTRVVGQTRDSTRSISEKSRPFEMKSDLILHSIDDPVGVPPEWTPPNVSVPVLNLVDKVFQLNRRGWIRRQVFWISKQILQLIMEDAVDDWLLRQINWLRREDVVAEGIHWIKDILWPDGKFFLKLAITESGLGGMDSPSFQATPRAGRNKSLQSGSFEEELEAIRRASYVKKMLFKGAPAPLVSLVGQKQYKRCARDIYYFLQSSVCMKQVAYSALELLLVSVFPELKDVVADTHKKMQSQSV